MINNIKKYDFPSIVLSFVATILLFTDHFMFESVTRVGQKNGLTAIVLGKKFYILLVLTLIIFFIAFIKKDNEKLNIFSVFISVLCWALTIVFCGLFAFEQSELGNTSRFSMSISSYIYVITIYLIQIKCGEFIKEKWKYYGIVSIGFIIITGAIFLGLLDNLAVAVEYKNRALQFNMELKNHMLMAFYVVISSVIIGLPVGAFVYKNKRLGKIIMYILNTLQSIPSLALICAMMFPLAFLSNNVAFLRKLGVYGVGATPVYIALLCYSVFELVNAMYGALEFFDDNFIEVAKGMGMTNRQIFLKVELPIVLPIIISGIRVALINTILGVTIGAYVGYGGLGIFIQQGITGFAIDIVALVTIPVMVIILICNFVLKESVVIIEKYRIYKGRVSI